ncbi:MAG: hypothetical protein ACI3V5_01015 [Faecousia sp.]
MKRIMTGILAAALVFWAGTTQAFASGRGHGHHTAAVKQSCVCDFAHVTCSFADQDGDGVCDVCAKNADECGCGRSCADADQDGICDYKACAFADENADGICDRCGKAAGKCGCGRNCADPDNVGTCHEESKTRGCGCHGGRQIGG